MKIIITTVFTGIHSQMTIDVESLHRASKEELDTLSKISAVVKKYNDDQDKNA